MITAISDDFVAIEGRSNGGGGIVSTGVYGSSPGVGYGVYGLNTGGGTGVYGGNTAGGYGVYGSNTAGGYGVWGASNSGTAVVAQSTAGMALRASAWHSGIATVANHVALIENNSDVGSADVLALRINEAVAAIGSGNNYITFFDSGGTSLGSIQGNGAGGVAWGGPGEDYAEYLLRLDPSETIEPGDIVGVFAGRVSKATDGADQLLVVSTAPIVAGNDPGEEHRAVYELVAFIGQVQVQVRGPVTAGDFIIPSGLDDGSGVAIAPEAITAAQFAQVVGQAWEDADNTGLKTVRVAVGLVQSDPTVVRLVERVQSQEARLAAIEARLAQLEAAPASDPAVGQ